MIRDSTPLAVDLDKTLLCDDSTVLFLKLALASGDFRPFMVAWRGIPRLKAWLATHHTPDMPALPWNAAILEIISRARSAGQPVWLVTASHQLLARRVARYLGLDGFVGSTLKNRLKGKTKAQWLVSKFGQSGYDYCGDSSPDIPCWNNSRTAWIPARLPRRIRDKITCGDVREYFPVPLIPPLIIGRPL